MSDVTGTLWVILMTPRKKLLTKISSLKKYGKLKIEELRVLYGRKKVGGWIFQILGQPQSKTYSFHDGDVLRKTDQGYKPLRKWGIRFYLLCSMLIVLGMAANVLIRFGSKHAVIRVEAEPVANVVEEQEKPSAQKIIQPPPTEKQKADKMISEAHYFNCNNWIRQHEERKAVIACEKAVVAYAHGKAAAFLSAQEQKAKKLYLEAYTLQKFQPEIARKKYAMVLQSAKTKSTWRGKAQYQLRKLKK